MSKDELDPKCPPPLREFGRHGPNDETWTEISVNMVEMIRQAAAEAAADKTKKEGE